MCPTSSFWYMEICIVPASFDEVCSLNRLGTLVKDQLAKKSLNPRIQKTNQESKFEVNLGCIVRLFQKTQNEGLES